MLGYVKTNAQELRLREHRVYRALYCGLCRRMGKCTGNCSRMTLSYDFVFLAAVRLSLTGEKIEIEKRRCLIHPFRARPVVKACQALDDCADASALLVYHKLCDDIRDERGWKRLRARFARLFLKKAYRKARSRHPDLDLSVAEHLRALSDYESATEFPGADAPAEQFGLVMGDVFAEGLSENAARIAADMGCAIGHWIYLVDAADDFSEDLKKDRYNPYRKLFGDAPTEADWENVRLSLTAHLCRLERGFLLMDRHSTGELHEILANILYIGLPETGERVTSPQAGCKACRKEKTP